MWIRIVCVFIMIVFDKLWKTMKDRGISQYKLIRDYKVSSEQLDRLRKNGNVSTYTLDQLCKILNCRLDVRSRRRRRFKLTSLISCDIVRRKNAKIRKQRNKPP